MGKTAVVFSCCHATPETSNERFSWLGNFLFDLKPDYVVDLGDFADMKSLNTYDTRYPKAVMNQSYQADINTVLDARERIWHPFKKAKRKMPRRYGFEGNHENRIKRAVSFDPRLEGKDYGIHFSHLENKYFYEEYHEYHNGAPAIHEYDGVSYAHYFSAGNFGRALSGTHHAYALLQQRHGSSTCGHSHKRSIYFKDGVHGKGIIGLVAGSFKGADEQWAGQANSDWWKGVIIKRNIENGYYDPEFVSMDQLKKVYGNG